MVFIDTRCLNAVLRWGMGLRVRRGSRRHRATEALLLVHLLICPSVYRQTSEGPANFSIGAHNAIPEDPDKVQ